jgi:hypothetical protein
VPSASPRRPSRSPMSRCRAASLRVRVLRPAGAASSSSATRWPLRPEHTPRAVSPDPADAATPWASTIFNLRSPLMFRPGTVMIPETLEGWTLSRLRKLLASGAFENDRLEWKEQLPRDDVGKQRVRLAMAAFANASGGFLLFRREGRPDHTRPRAPCGCSPQARARSRTRGPSPAGASRGSST